MISHVGDAVHYVQALRASCHTGQTVQVYKYGPKSYFIGVRISGPVETDHDYKMPITQEVARVLVTNWHVPDHCDGIKSEIEAEQKQVALAHDEIDRILAAPAEQVPMPEVLEPTFREKLLEMPVQDLLALTEDLHTALEDVMMMLEEKVSHEAISQYIRPYLK